MSKVRVYIPTTDGPVQVERITREPAAQSAVCVGRTTRVLPISGAYDSFVRPPSGVIEREFGPFDPGAFRLDVSAPIADGESWQAGIFVAHALAAVGRLAGPDEPCEAALWITGALDNDLKIGGVGHVPEKFRASDALFSELAAGGIELQIFLPTDNEEAAVGSAGGHTYSGMAAASEILAEIGISTAPPANRTDVPATSAGGRSSRSRLWVALLLSGVVVAGVAAVVVDKMQQVTPNPTPPAAKSPTKTAAAAPAQKPAEEPPPAAKPKPKAQPPTKPEAPSFRPPVIEIIELRAPTGVSCAAIQFGKAKATAVPVERVDGDYADSKLPGLCGLEIGVDAGNHKAYARVSVQTTRGRLIKSGALPTAFSGDTAFSGRLSWRFFVPKRLPHPLEYEISFTAGPASLTQANSKTTLIRHRVVP